MRRLRNTGGDEASSTTAAGYSTFVNHVQQIVAAHGKAVVGWHDVTRATPLASTVAQFWGTGTSDSDVADAAAHGTKVIMSPVNRAYLDMKYTSSTALGQNWAGLIDVNKAYDWNPGAYLSGVGESSVLGVEGPLWTETIVTSANIDYTAFPRLPALAGLGWSPQSTHGWPRSASGWARRARAGRRWASPTATRRRRPGRAARDPALRARGRRARAGRSRRPADASVRSAGRRHRPSLWHQLTRC
ncbi:family 20 glycosylhydrolase [Actinacidiphila sp. ITFR-21]|uniref:family 20 glycosylhydrolase n=1 Tax=Actinacidiphila sp. ITFR-21 TaxID=3075199 RepID=UPI00288921E5|nr:family 20 glycosylhydrolase [Streptomyces sp. ITFR-21]WNI19461.1 family 20 glycosylhydrolase [Streptomyces sp. ITFR-21]